MKCVFTRARNSLARVGTKFEIRMNQSFDTSVEGCDWRFAGDKRCPFWIFSPKTPSFAATTEDIRSPSTKSSVPCSRGNVKFSSSVSGCPVSSGYCHISVGYPLESNQPLVHSDIWNCRRESPWMFIDFVVVAYKRQLSAASKSAIGRPPEFSNLSNIELLIPEWVFSLRSSESRFCIHCKSKLTNRSIVKNVFLNELFLSSGNNKFLCERLQKLEPHGSICKNIHFFFVLIILGGNTTNEGNTITLRLSVIM